MITGLNCVIRLVYGKLAIIMYTLVPSDVQIKLYNKLANTTITSVLTAIFQLNLGSLQSFGREPLGMGISGTGFLQARFHSVAQPTVSNALKAPDSNERKYSLASFLHPPPHS